LRTSNGRHRPGAGTRLHLVLTSRPGRAVLACLGAAVAVLVVLALTAGLQPRGRTVLDPAPTVLTAGASVDGGSTQTAPAPPDTAAGSPAAPRGASAAPAGGSASAPGPPPVAPPTAPQTAPAPPATARFTAVAGESCPNRAGSGFFRTGFASDWYTRSSGGWTGDGCQGRMVAVPMSGDARRDDNDNVIVWWFTPGAGRSCALSVYVPGTGNVKDADGAPAQYFVYGSVDASGPATGSFTVDQVHNQGRFVDVGSYHESTGALSVRMVTRGIDFGPGRSGAHLGVSAARVAC